MLVHLVKGGVEIQLVAKPKSKLVRVAFNRLQHCPKEISDAIDGPEQFWSEEQLKPSVNKEQVTYDASAECRPSVSDKEPIDISKPVDDSTTDVPSSTNVSSSATDDLVELPNGGDIAGGSINDNTSGKIAFDPREKDVAEDALPKDGDMSIFMKLYVTGM